MKDFSQKVLSGFAGKIGIVSLMAICFALFSSSIKAQTTLVQNTGTIACCGFTETGITQQSISGNDYLGLTQSTSTLISPTFSLDGTTGETLTFKARTFGGVNTANNTITISISTDNGATYTTLGTATPTSTAFTTFTFDLSSYSGTQVLVRFQTLGSASGRGAGIDDILVQGNVATAAGATIGGRIVSSNGRGIRNVRIMLAGGSLTEPIYATSTSFGYYQFPQVPSGETYVLQVFSKNYIFDSSSMVINLIEDLTETNFTGRLHGNALTGR